MSGRLHRVRVKRMTTLVLACALACTPALALAFAVALAPAALSAQDVAQGPDFPRGAVTAHVIRDASFGRTRRVWVYTPPGYDAKRKAPYPVVLAFDGAIYLDSMPLPRVLDSLLALKRTTAFVAVLVDDSSGAVRTAELGNAARMPVFIATQLVPWLRRGWHVTRDPARVIATGSSAGGLGASHLALTRPDVVGNVFSQSGAFWRSAEGSNGAPYEWLTQRVGLIPKQPVRFVLDVGALEDHATLGGSGPNFRDATRRFRDALSARGYDVTYVEVPEGNHGEAWWRQRLAAGLVALSARWPST